MSSLFAEHALLDDGWATDVRIDIDSAGNIEAIERGTAPGSTARARGPVIPGMPDLHGHAFQRAMAGLAEQRSHDRDDFWSWREAMYRLVAELQPEQMHAIAAQLYVELLRAGFTAIAEFHYLHHGPDGTPYDDVAETSGQVIEAARRTGIAITHLPVLYGRGGFADEPLGAAQSRFRTDPETIAAILERLRTRYADKPCVHLGLAPHSLRAASPENLRSAVAQLHEADASAPVHIHVAEQGAEVRACLDATGLRPVAWLLEHAAIDRRWCLVHATHTTAEEVAQLAATGAIAGLCPTTEANLGDGVFPFEELRAAGGSFGVGTDSHVGRSAADELRWLEYGQRLTRQRRNVAASPETPSVGRTLWEGAARGGAAALAQPVGAIAAGLRADLVVLDAGHVDLAGLQGDAILDAYLFSAGDSCVTDVMVGGRWVVRDGHHPDEAEIETRYRATLASLRA